MERKEIMNKSTSLVWKVNEDNSHHHDLSVEAMNLHEQPEENYNTLVDVQAITTKVVYKGIATLKKEISNVEAS